MFKYIPVVFVVLAWAFEDAQVDATYWPATDRLWREMDMEMEMEPTTSWPWWKTMMTTEYPRGDKMMMGMERGDMMMPGMMERGDMMMTTMPGMEQCFMSPMVKICASKITKDMKLQCMMRGMCPVEMMNKHTVRRMLCEGRMPMAMCMSNTMMTPSMMMEWPMMYKNYE